MVEVSTPVKWLLRVLAIGYVFFLVAWPVTTIVREAFGDGLGTFVESVRTRPNPDSTRRIHSGSSSFGVSFDLP